MKLDYKANYMNEFLTLLLPWPFNGTPNVQISDIFVYGIFALYIILLVIFLRKTIRRTSSISRLSKEVDKLGGKYDRPANPSILNDLEEIFEHNDELFRKAWQEFKESLITPERRDVVYKTDEASLFFSEERLLEQYMNLRFWNSVPAILVGLGILGTFVGLVWGLVPFSGIDWNDTEDIQDAIKILLSGVSTAFVTSVWGMLVSLLFNWLEKKGIGKVNHAIANLQGALDLPFTLKTQEEIADKQKYELEQQTAALKSFSTDLADDIKGAMREGRQEILSELNKTVEAFSTTILEQLKPILERLMEAIEELRQQKEESSAEAIKELIEKFQESLSASTVTQMEELAKTVGEASQSLKDLPDQISVMIASVQEQINETRRLLSETSHEQTAQMNSMMEGMINSLQAVVELAAKQTGEQLDLQMENMKTVSDESIQMLQKTIAELQQSITETVTQQQEAINKITSQTAQASTDATDQLSQLIEKITSSLSETVQGAEKSISKLLQQQSTQTDTFNEQIANSKDTLESGQKLLEEMRTSLTGVRQIIEETQLFSNQLTNGADQLKSAGQQLIQASIAFNQQNERYLTENRETIQTLENLHGQTLQLINNSTQRFQTIDEGLQAIFEQIEKGLNTYSVSARESINTYLSDFSNQLSQAVAALSSSIEALEDNFEDLNDRIERLIR